MPEYVHSSVFQTSVERLFAFHEAPDALQRLMPPWQPAEVISRAGGLSVGARVELELKLGPFRLRWVARHTEFVRNRLFADIQESGPFRRWSHRHEFAPEGAAARLTDRVEFSLPGGRLVDFLGAAIARHQLRRLFAYRHAVTKQACEG
ncbi:SRPBCC family protein [Paludibaculum fermentans]|uniref:SRPBCC family protein n=1 Tax=Paludibaculum fermentans TaxID=1473598 RepID=A0A7S7NNT3_PALFE|nr:SRPBCC family protein [Paludibaculum fermentans]QOY86974.1 SRPBCC family protein [Paludibaculum fermentans]